MRIVLIGSRGMLGSAFDDGRIIMLNRPEIDVTNPESVYKSLSAIKPQVVINASGITDIPFCQANPGTAFQVNLAGAINVAIACIELGAKLIQFSTVFSGSSNVYTQTKMYMENILPEVSKDLAILRLPWLFAGKTDKKFLSTVISCLKDGRPVTVYDDEVGSPTYTADVARYVLDNIESLHGVQDMANKGEVTRRQWALKIAEILGYKNITFMPIERKIPMKVNSVVTGGIILRPWQEALEACLG